MDTVRQTLITLVIARMSDILTTNTYETPDGPQNYQTDIGANVRDWETKYQEEDLPALSVCDLVEEVSMNTDSIAQIQSLKILLRIFKAKDSQAEYFRQCFGDIYAAIRQDTRWKVNDIGTAIGTIIKSAGIILKDDVFEIGGAAVEIEIFYHTKAFDAFKS